MTPLDQLNDISTPSEVSMWPLAWGWWAVAAIAIAIVAITIVSIVRHIKRHRARKQGLRMLLTLQEQANSNAKNCNELLKRVAMVYADPQRVASLYGKQWAAFLLATLKGTKRTQQIESQLNDLASAHYSPNSTTIDVFEITEYWLSHVCLKTLQDYSNKEKALV